MIAAAVLASAILCPRTQAATENKAAEMAALLHQFIAVRDGQAPEKDTAKTIIALSTAAADLDAASTALQDNSPGFEGRCARYVRLTTELNRQTSHRLTIYADDPEQLSGASDIDVENRVRLQIEISKYAEMAFLFASGAEGGFDLLNPSLRQKCPFKDREKVEVPLRKAADSLTTAFRAAFGVEGLNQMDETETRLLQIASRQEDSNRAKIWGVMIGGTAVSLAAWEIAPPLMADVLRALWGRTVTLGRWAAFGVRTAAISGELVALNAITDHLTGANWKPDDQRIFLDGWDDHLDQTEQFLRSPPSAVEMALRFISRLHRLVIAKDMTFFTTYSDLITQEEKQWGSVDQALVHYENKEPTLNRH